MTTDADRRINLQKVWEKCLPCYNCHLKGICKYAFTLKRVDYPSDVFGISITCKVKDNYKAVNP